MYYLIVRYEFLCYSLQDISGMKRLSLTSPPLAVPNLTSISPLPEIRRDSSCSAEINLESLPVPKQFADSRHGSFAETAEGEK